MKGLNIKKLAAVAVGTALVGSALAPMVAAAVMNNTDQLTKADLVNTTTGAPMVQVAVGSDAAISDFIWAGNIAAKVAQLATTEENVVVSAGGDSGSSATISDKKVDVTVGGTVSYSSESSFVFQDANYPMNSVANTPEFVRSLGNGQLTFLANTQKSYTWAGSSYTVQVTETIPINVDAKFDTTASTKDMAAFIDSGNFKYVLAFGGTTNNGIPARQASTANTGVFTKGDSDNIVVPLFGDSYTVNKIDKTASPTNVRLIKESAKTTYYEGNEITGLKGKGSYAGKELKVKIAAITQEGTAVATYKARMELYDTEGNLVDTQTVGSGSFLDDMFLSNGTYVLDTMVYVPTIAVESSTNKGYVTATVGKGVLRLYDGKKYPYDSTDTNSSNYYWKTQLDFNTSASTSPAYVDTLQKITIYNGAKVWNDASTAVTRPLFPGSEALQTNHQDTAYQEAKFLDGLNIPEDTLGYNFVKLKFDGFKQDKTIVTYKIGKIDGCSGPSTTGCVTYKDSGNVERKIPFYMELSAVNGGKDTGNGTWTSFDISGVTFWYRCSTADVNFKLGTKGDATLADGNYLNGTLINWATDGNIATDWGLADVNNSADNGSRLGSYVDLNGVSYLVTGTTQQLGYVGLYADGNCQFSSTDPTTNVTPTYVGASSTILNNTIYYADVNGARIQKATRPLAFTAANLTDTYRYAFTLNEQQGRGYLMLDKTTNFSTPYSNFDVNFIGTDVAETGWVLINPALNPTQLVATSYRSFYAPAIVGLGRTDTQQYYIAQFGVDANGGSTDDMVLNIQTDIGKPIPLPNNSNLSNWSCDVNAYPLGKPWTLTTATTSGSELTQAYLDYGSKISLDSDKVTIVGPETQTYLKLSVIGKSATSTVTGGQQLTGIAEGEKKATDAGTEVTVDKINVTATCPAAGGATATAATYKKVYPVGEMVVADTVSPSKAIIVGGYLVNKLAREVVLSDGTRLAEALTASGDRVVDVLNDGSIVVAGYTAADTKQAAQDLISALDSLLG
ncbi:MAG: S-layer protein [Candidatus ainarchaeum sp.]|nr:S-layer protein [Candidatus ainarchaeum sp.]